MIPESDFEKIKSYCLKNHLAWHWIPAWEGCHLIFWDLNTLKEYPKCENVEDARNVCRQIMSDRKVMLALA